MPAKRISISNLYQGISSTQPPNRRAAGTVSDLLNGVCETIIGTSKRRGTIPRGSVAINNYAGKGGTTSPINTTDFVVINLQGKRIFIDVDGRVLCYDEDGSQIEVIDQTNTNFAYIQGDLDDLDWVVAYDTAIILNRNTNVAIADHPAYVLTKTVNVYSELPKSDVNPEEPIPNAYYRVLLRENSDPAGYYQYLDGQYVRATAPSDPDSNYDLTTMPHRFVYDPIENRVFYRTMPFKNRISGNGKTNRVLPLEGKPILSINYFQSRLVLLNDSTLNLSANGDIYQLFVNDVDNVVVSDRISRDILENNLGTPYRTTVLGGSLLITCQNGILVFDANAGNEVLTNINGSLRKITDTKCANIRMAGGNGIRVAIADQNNMIHIFTVVDPQVGPQQYNTINDYDPRLLRGKNIRQIFMDGQEVYVLDQDGGVWIHRSELAQGTIVQLAWSRFSINNRKPRWIDNYNNYMRFTCLPADGYTSPFMTFVDWEYQINNSVDAADNSGYDVTQFNINLDSKEQATGTYDPSTDETRFEHSYEFADINHSVVVDAKTGVTHRPIRVSDYYFWVRGKVYDAAQSTYIGFTYDFSMTLSELWSGSSDIRLLASSLSIFYQNTSDFDVEIGRTNGKKRIKHFSVRQYNNVKLGITNPTVEPYNNPNNTGSYKVLLIGDVRSTTIRFINETAGNVTINAIEYGLLPKG